jgi:hypothetical protein
MSDKCQCFVYWPMYRVLYFCTKITNIKNEIFDASSYSLVFLIVG